MHTASPLNVAAVVFLTVSCCRFAHAQDSLPPRLHVVDESVSLQQVPANVGPLKAEVKSVEKAKVQACVLLKNDNVLFGHARQLGEFVMVTTAAGGEVRLPRLSVACWADNIRDLYQFRIDQRGKPTLRNHLRDAHWCVRYDLYDLAAKELIAARRIEPNNKEAIVLENRLRNLVAPRSANTPTAARIGSGKISNLVSHEKNGIPTPMHSDHLNTVEFEPDTVRRFASHIQPMLINRCGVCHQTMARTVDNQTVDAKWNLLVPSVGSRASAAITRRNMQALISYIDPNTPSKSLLLEMATNDHGGSLAPLSQRNTKAIQSLEYWVKIAADSVRSGQQVSRSDGGLTEESVQVSHDEEPTSVSGTSPLISMDSALDRALANGNGQSTAEPLAPAVEEMSGPGAKSAPHRLPPVSNPFDPDLFNRRFHAAKSK